MVANCCLLSQVIVVFLFGNAAADVNHVATISEIATNPFFQPLLLSLEPIATIQKIWQSTTFGNSILNFDMISGFALSEEVVNTHGIVDKVNELRTVLSSSLSSTATELQQQLAQVATEQYVLLNAQLALVSDRFMDKAIQGGVITKLDEISSSINQLKMTTNQLKDSNLKELVFSYFQNQVEPEVTGALSSLTESVQNIPAIKYWTTTPVNDLVQNTATFIAQISSETASGVGATSIAVLRQLASSPLAEAIRNTGSSLVQSTVSSIQSIQPQTLTTTESPTLPLVLTAIPVPQIPPPRVLTETIATGLGNTLISTGSFVSDLILPSLGRLVINLGNGFAQSGQKLGNNLALYADGGKTVIEKLATNLVTQTPINIGKALSLPFVLRDTAVGTFDAVGVGLTKGAYLLSKQAKLIEGVVSASVDTTVATSKAVSDLAASINLKAITSDIIKTTESNVDGMQSFLTRAKDALNQQNPVSLDSIKNELNQFLDVQSASINQKFDEIGARFIAKAEQGGVIKRLDELSTLYEDLKSSLSSLSQSAFAVGDKQDSQVNYGSTSTRNSINIIPSPALQKFVNKVRYAASGLSDVFYGVAIRVANDLQRESTQLVTDLTQYSAHLLDEGDL